jgi:hypothetical protein
MTADANVIGNVENVAIKTSSESRDTIAFFAIVALALVVTVVAGVLFGLGGIGAVAIAEAALMLVICLILTRG